MSRRCFLLKYFSPYIVATFGEYSGKSSLSIFDERTEEVLKSYYFSEQETEISLCLEGYKAEDYRITSLYQPKIYQAAYNQVSFEPCSAETMIILHTHPYKRCIASGQDLEMLEKSKLSNPEVLMVVMCGPDRFSVYE